MPGRFPRMLLVPVVLPLLMTASGCMFGRNTGQTVTNGPVIPPPGAVVKKAEPGPKRKPKPQTVVAVAILREQAGDRPKVTPEDRNRFYDEARKLFQEALEIDAKHLPAIQGLARVYSKLGDHEKAQGVLDHAVVEFPRELQLWHDLGMARNRGRNFAGAAECFRKALEIDPDNRGSMQLLGFTLARAGRIEESIPYLTKSMGKAGAHYNVARMLAHLGRGGESAGHLRLALQASPDHQAAREMLARLENPASPGNGIHRAGGSNVPRPGTPGTTAPGTIPPGTPPGRFPPSGSNPRLDIVTLE